MKAAMRTIFVAGAVVLAAGLAGGSAHAADPLTLRSPALDDGGTIAAKYSGNAPPNCTGENLSPPLAWANPPAGTRSFALILLDLDGGFGLGFVHMVTYGIPAEVNGFAEGDLSKPSPKFVGGKSGPGLPTYFGPCPGPGGWHHYVFSLIATDLDPKVLPAGLTRDELLSALKGHAKGAAILVGRFRHQ